MALVVGGAARVGPCVFPPQPLQDEALSADDHARALVVCHHRALHAEGMEAGIHECPLGGEEKACRSGKVFVRGLNVVVIVG